MHECKIGMLYRYSGYTTELVTAADLIAHIKEKEDFNESVVRDGFEKICPDLIQKVFTLQNYGDRRKSTDLYRFDYCPECGKKINWKEIRLGNI